MKKWFAVLILLLSANVSAQNFEFETVRTPEVPGFFLVKVFPDPDAQPLLVQNIFVKNFSEKEAKIYAELLPMLEEFGGKIIDTDQLTQSRLRADNRIVILGDPLEKYLHFAPQSTETSLEEFESFAEKNLAPVLLQNLTTRFGGNISEIFPEKAEFVGAEPVILVGKFERPIKTRLEISGLTSEGELTMSAPLPLNDENTTRNPIVMHLPQIWEKLFDEAMADSTEGKITSSLLWAFPFVLAILGGLFILLGIRTGREKNSLFPKNFFDNMPSDVMTSAESSGAPTNPPFEIVPGEKKNHES